MSVLRCCRFFLKDIEGHSVIVILVDCVLMSVLMSHESDKTRVMKPVYVWRKNVSAAPQSYRTYSLAMYMQVNSVESSSIGYRQLVYIQLTCPNFVFPLRVDPTFSFLVFPSFFDLI